MENYVIEIEHKLNSTTEILQLVWKHSNMWIIDLHTCIVLQGPVSGMRQFLTTESPLKMMKNAFYFILKTFFALEIFSYLSWLFGYLEKLLDKKAKVNFKT